MSVTVGMPVPAPAPVGGLLATPTVPAVVGPDPRVAAAFALGWQMAELYRPDRRRVRASAAPDDLPGLGALGDDERLQLGVAQVRVALARLRETLARAEVAVPDVAPLVSAVDERADAAVRCAAVLELHRVLLRVLTAVDFKLGKAYGLGRALADTCRAPHDRAGLARELHPQRVATLRAWTADLSSALPPHAGHAVEASLARWSTWANDPSKAPADVAEVWPLLRRQGELWRALLSGEKLGDDMLEIGNYLDAAKAMAHRMRTVAVRVIVRFPVVALLIVALFAAGVWLILSLHTAASIAAGAGGIVTSLGLGWKGMGAAVGRQLGRVEKPLWGAELDAAITEAITMLPGTADDSSAKHRALALALPRAEAGGERP